MVQLYENTSPIHIEQPDEQAGEQATAQADEQAGEQQNEHIITILNLYFNYIINNGVKKFGTITDVDRESIILTLNRLEMYTNPETIMNRSNSDILDLQIQYWAIKEIYFSPYKIHLNNLTRQKFVLRFLKAKKYVSTSDTTHFINYFIYSLQEEFHKDKTRKDVN